MPYARNDGCATYRFVFFCSPKPPFHALKYSCASSLMNQMGLMLPQACFIALKAIASSLLLIIQPTGEPSPYSSTTIIAMS